MRSESATASRPRAGHSPAQLADDLRKLGLQHGQDLLIHCSLRQVGPLADAPAALLASIRDVSGPDATLVVPTQTPLNSLSSRAFRTATKGLDARGRERFIAGMAGFDPATTPSTGMGAFAEHLRTRPAAVRSGHPQTSFAALGPAARACTRVHDLDCHLGERSPLGWLYAHRAAIFLVGVGFATCTAFHLAEYRLPGERPVRHYHCFTGQGSRRDAHEFTSIDLDDSDFGLLGAEMEAAVPVRRGLVGAAQCRLVSLRPAVDFAVGWLETRRGQVRS
jgi:aminoglycoside 3-N-acetyltransferase